MTKTNKDRRKPEGPDSCLLMLLHQDQNLGRFKLIPRREAHRTNIKKSKRGRSVVRKKQKKRKHRRHRSPSSSSSDSSELSSSQSSSPSPPRQKHRAKKHKPSTVEKFEIISKKDRNQWELTGDLATYANNTKFIPDKDICDNKNYYYYYKQCLYRISSYFNI